MVFRCITAFASDRSDQQTDVRADRLPFHKAHSNSMRTHKNEESNRSSVSKGAVAAAQVQMCY